MAQAGPWYGPVSVLIHSSADGHWAAPAFCLTVMNDAAVSTRGLSLGGRTFSFLSGIHPGVELLVNMVTPCLTFGGTILFVFTIVN